jgi:HAD superfamily hydrolase (TIGR01509 family)
MLLASMIPEVVVFDLGKVLVEYDYAITARKIAPQCKVSASELRAVLDESPLFAQFECGLIGNEEFFREICARTGYCGLREEFDLHFADIFTEIKPMIRAHTELRERKIPTYILSNTNDISTAHIRRRFPFFANFDGYVLSYQHKVMKPDQKIYQLLEKLCGRSGPQILYLDDRLENTDGAKARGWQVIHHQSPEESVKSMKKLGLLNDTLQR